MKRPTLILTVLSITCAATAATAIVTWQNHAAVAGNSSKAESNELPVLFDAPKFALIDQDGKPFTSDQLTGKVWVCDFFFTSCGMICPRLTAKLVDFQNRSKDLGTTIVSFSVDPDTDKPDVMKQYAERFKADPTRWRFLTGTKLQTWEVSKGMKLSVEEQPGSQVMHSNRFMLVDANGKVRGTYDTDDADFMDRLLADAARLK